MKRASDLASAGRHEEAWRVVEPLSAQVATNLPLAYLWVSLARASECDQSVGETASGILAAWPRERALTLQAASLLIRVAEARPFDEAPLPDGPARIAADALKRVLGELSPDERSDSRLAVDIYSDLAMALRMTGSQDDGEALEAMQNALRLDPENGSLWFQLGLLHKWRGRWSEGVEANRRAREFGSDGEGVLWNLAICATGAGFHPVAASVMKELGMKGKVGEDGVFAGLFDPVQIRVSSLGEGIDPAAHIVGNEPDFEYLWIERHSLVHGTVMNATLRDLPVDFGDVVLFDGAAVGWRDDGKNRVPRFPLLQKLRSGRFRRYRFRARQPRPEFLTSLDTELPDGVFFYVHDEQVNMLCRECANAGVASEKHEHPEALLVSGKLVVPEQLLAADLRLQIDRLLAGAAAVAVPGFHRDLGDEARALSDQQLWGELESERTAATQRVTCKMHGTTAPAFVCKHLVEGESLGFFLSADEAGDTRPDAWCAACEQVVIDEHGWNERSEAFAQVRMICTSCYDEAKARNLKSHTGSTKRKWWELWKRR